MSNKPIYTPTGSFETPIIEDDIIASEYDYNINYGTTRVKINNRADDSPEHRIVLQNSCSFTMMPDLPHNVVNKLDDYTLSYGPLEYETTGSVFKESYILPSRPPWDAIDYIVSASYGASGSMTFVTQSNGDVIVLGDDDNIGIVQEPQFLIQAPFLVDDSGSRTTATLEITTKKVQGKDVDIFRYTADSTWLDNAVYPVVIDPTTIIYSTSNVLVFYQSNNRMVARASNGNLIFTHGERTTWRIRALIAQGDNFDNMTPVNITTGTTFLDYQNIILADNGNLVCIYRSRNTTNHFGVKISSDNGLTWGSENNITSALGAWNGNGVTACKSGDGTIWCQGESGSGTYEIGLFYSTNHGVSWTHITGIAVRQWYGDLCWDRKNDKILIVGCEGTGVGAKYRSLDVSAKTWDYAYGTMSVVGVPNRDRCIMGAMATDNNGNTIVQVRYRYTSDSIYYNWEYKWPDGGTPGAPNLITVGGTTLNLYGSLYCDRSGTFHDIMIKGATATDTGIWYAKYRYGETPVYNYIAETTLNYDSNQVSNFINNLNEESVYENQIAFLQYDSIGAVYYLTHVDNIAQQVGPTIMPMIG